MLIEEYKSSATAPLTSNQRDGFVELLESGGIIVGEGKGIFINGVEIPPGTAVKIVRPNIREWYNMKLKRKDLDKRISASIKKNWKNIN